ncbi:MAG: DUF998 domain-containing protein [Candidatus Thorarchaeota archaeon]
MSTQISKWRYLLASAFLGGSLYCILTYVSFILFPGSFTLDDYLSVLGNSSLNPNGAIFYNLAVMQVGVLLPLFYLGLYKTFGEERKNLFVIAVLIGFLNSLSVMMSGVFSEDMYELHYFWSFMIFATWIPVLFLTNFALLKRSGPIKWVSLYGLALAVFDTLFVFYVLLIGTDSGAIIEWITIFSFIIWAILLASSALRESVDSSTISKEL